VVVAGAPDGAGGAAPAAADNAECDGDHTWLPDSKISHLSAGMPGRGFVKWSQRANAMSVTGRLWSEG